MIKNINLQQIFNKIKFNIPKKFFGSKSRLEWNWTLQSVRIFQNNLQVVCMLSNHHILFIPMKRRSLQLSLYNEFATRKQQFKSVQNMVIPICYSKLSYFPESFKLSMIEFGHDAQHLTQKAVRCTRASRNIGASYNIHFLNVYASKSQHIIVL